MFGTAVFLYGGRPFVQGAVRELRDRLPGMMTLIALAITVAFVFSAAVTLGYPGMPLWEELATLVTIMLLGHWIEMRSIIAGAGRAGGAGEAAARHGRADRAMADGREEAGVRSAALRRGRPRARPAGREHSGRWQSSEGRSAVNEAMITGESRAGRRRSRATR